MKRIYLLVFGIFCSIILRTYFILNGSDIADIHSLHEMGELFLRGINPYLALNYNAYPPLAIYLEFATIKLSQFFNIPFYILIKLWPNLADILTGLVLCLFLIKKGVKPIVAYAWSLTFLLNPISIIISAAHGQIDSIPSFLVILAILFLTFNFTKFYILLSALLLGLAIAIKPNPLILLPFFLTFKKMDLKTMIIFLLLTVVPVAILFSPFIQGNFHYILGKSFGYSGSNDFGLPAILRGIYYQQTANYKLIFSREVLQASKVFFLTGLFLLVFIFKNCDKLVKACLAVYLLFLGFYFGISAQYLSWILPLAILERDKMIIPFSLSGLVSLLGFYLFFNPTILAVQFSNIQPYQNQFMLIYILGNLVFWAVTSWWLIKIISPNFKNLLIFNLH